MDNIFAALCLVAIFWIVAKLVKRYPLVITPMSIISNDIRREEEGKTILDPIEEGNRQVYELQRLSYREEKEWKKLLKDLKQSE